MLRKAELWIPEDGDGVGLLLLHPLEAGQGEQHLPSSGSTLLINVQTVQSKTKDGHMISNIYLLI